MEKILTSVKPVVESSKFVKINKDTIADFVKTVDPKELDQAEFNSETVVEGGSEETNVALSFIYNSINFCYWGEPKWAIDVDSQVYDGSAGMLRALKQAINKEKPLDDPKYLATIPEEELQNILRGNIQIPLFHQRLEMLRTLGRIVEYQFDGSFIEVIKRGKYNVQGIVDLLVSNFPEVFDDSDDYKGQKVYFYKRAQLVPAHLFDLFKFGYSKNPISGMDDLTAFADYKVPQVMRKYGILEYSGDLAQKIDQKIEIPAGSDEEIEVRANTVWANELVTGALKLKFSQANAIKTDAIFWFRGQVKSRDDKPYHRTRTTRY